MDKETRNELLAMLYVQAELKNRTAQRAVRPVEVADWYYRSLSEISKQMEEYEEQDREIEKEIFTNRE